MSFAKRIAVSLNSMALALCLYSLLLRPHVLGLFLATGFTVAIVTVIALKARWMALIAAAFCVVVGSICAVAAFELARTDAWHLFLEPNQKILFFLILVPLGAVGPLLTVYVLYHLYARPPTAAQQRPDF